MTEDMKRAAMCQVIRISVSASSYIKAWGAAGGDLAFHLSGVQCCAHGWSVQTLLALCTFQPNFGSSTETLNGLG